MAKDHYVPQFYLNRWAKTDRKISSFVIMKDGMEIKHYEKYSSEIGFKCKLYEEQEELFFKGLDNQIAKILNRLDKASYGNHNSLQLSLEERECWSVFIAAQIIRTPKVIDEINNCFKNNHKFKQIMVLWKYEEAQLCELIREQIVQIIKNDRCISDLNKMQWTFFKVKTNNEIITCDDPIIFDNPLNHISCLLLLPLSPDSFALGVNNLKHEIFKFTKEEIVKFINQRIIVNASERIFSRSKYSINGKFLKKSLNLRK